MKIGLIAMSGVRVKTPELAALGVTLPQFVNRGKVIASLPSLGLLTVGVGVLHLVWPEPFVRIMPPGLPAPLTLVYVSGVFEILGGLGVLVPEKRELIGQYGIKAVLAASLSNLMSAALAGLLLTF